MLILGAAVFETFPARVQSLPCWRGALNKCLTDESLDLAVKPLNIIYFVMFAQPSSWELITSDIYTISNYGLQPLQIVTMSVPKRSKILWLALVLFMHVYKISSDLGPSYNKLSTDPFHRGAQHCINFRQHTPVRYSFIQSQVCLQGLSVTILKFPWKQKLISFH